MKIAVMAPGGVGGYFGGRLADAGHDVTFIARGANLEAIRQSGLRVTSPLGDIHLTAPSVTDDAAEIGPVDIVLFAVKLNAMEAAAEACRPLIGPETAVVPFLNGVDAPAILAEVLGADHACGGVTYISAHIEGPGHIGHIGDFAKLVFGEMDGSMSDRLDALQRACADSGIDATLTPEIEVALWEKFSLLVPMSGMTAAARSPLGVIRSDPMGRHVFEACMRETVAVGIAKGIPLADDLVDRQMSLFNGLPDEMKASMLVDLEAERPLEAPWLSGAVARMGRELGVPTPVNDTLFAAMQPFVMGRPGD